MGSTASAESSAIQVGPLFPQHRAHWGPYIHLLPTVSTSPPQPLQHLQPLLWLCRITNWAAPSFLSAQSIPNLKGHGKYQKPNESWKQAIQDWLHPDPAAGLVLALKDWDPAWVQGVNGKTNSRGPKYHQQKLVAGEHMVYVLGFKAASPWY